MSLSARCPVMVAVPVALRIAVLRCHGDLVVRMSRSGRHPQCIDHRLLAIIGLVHRAGDRPR